MRRNWTPWLALAAALALLAACGTRQPPPVPAPEGAAPGGVSQEFVYNLGEEPPTLDPALMTDLTSFTVANAIFEGLTRVGPKGVEPGMAERWDVSPDGLTYTFHLRDARWQNGDPVTAHDFVFSWQRALAPETASEYAYQLYYIKNGEKYNKGEIKDPAQLGVRALNDRTLQVQLEAPTPYFLGLTAFPTYLPVHRKTVEANKQWAAEAATIVGNGPFKITTWKHKDLIVLEKSTTYWDARSVRLNKITMRMVTEASTARTMFENNELHINGMVPQPEIPQLLASGQAKKGPLLGTYYLVFNTKKKPFDDPRVRKALALAIDRKAIVENVTKGGQVPAYAFVPPGLTNPATNADFRQEGGDFIREDVAEAKRLLAEAGYPDGKGFPAITFLYNTSESHKAIAEAIQEMWKKNLGIQNVTLQNQEWKVFLQSRQKGAFDVARAGWIGDYLDPMTFVDLFTSTSGNNETGWSNPRYDALVRQAKATVDQKGRMQAMHEAEKILFDEMPIVPIYYYVSIWQEKEWIKGVFRNALGIEDFKWAYVEKH